MFGKKAQLIAELKAEVERLKGLHIHEWNQTTELQSKLKAAQNQLEYLVRTIRDIDQELFNMSQQTNWAGMRPFFLKLIGGMTARKVAESDRIADILRPELITTYNAETNANAPKKITKS